MTREPTQEMWAKAEEAYYHYINKLNADNKSYTKPTLTEFRARLVLQNPDILVNFHNWLTPQRMEEFR